MNTIIRAGTRVDFNGTDPYTWTGFTKNVNSANDAYGIIDRTASLKDDLVDVKIYSKITHKQLFLTGSRRAVIFKRSHLVI